MRINEKIKIRNVAGEQIAMLHDKDMMTRVVAFNETALYLWNSLLNKDFTIDDAANLLLEKYDVDEATAKNDAAAWVKNLENNGLLI